MVPTRTIAFCDLVTNLLQQLLDTRAGTRLIFCGTRAEFLVQLSAAIHAQDAGSGDGQRHSLLTKSIGLLANSSKVRIAFCPSLESLRAYMAVLGPDNDAALAADDPERPQVLAIANLVALHTTTTEFSAQGLSRTFAAAVETASRTGMDLLLCECTNASMPSSTDWGPGLWDTQIPLLNGSVRLRGEEGAWGGRGVPVKHVAERWFEFNRPEV
ncbi:hypothetical protein N7532_005355 [Penicillium argentinense]|uniref:Uncharacterized protein n=1 Tax=Penicillium argentinense TaxID=1131581 RepID=A0A9W9K9S1_9EURO|nr:uncharacterized protein N7532_005355 [Penicillium argentinense]KAJ5098354.1 hypothetical protein N7532_005355 [Penicillium argentinense]